MPSEARIVLKAGREKSLRHRHPWIFSGAIERVEDGVFVFRRERPTGLIVSNQFFDRLTVAAP